MTEENWEVVEKNIKIPYSPVRLKCDEYEVVLILERIKDLKFGIVIYVNEVMKVEWLTNDCEERRRFLRPRSKSLYSKEGKESLKKISKKRLKEYGIDLDAKYIWYEFYWTSFRSLKRHLIKNNNSIELMRQFNM